VGLGWFIVGNPGNPDYVLPGDPVDYTATIVKSPNVGVLQYFTYTTQIPSQHYSMYGSIRLDDVLFNPLLADGLFTVSWWEDSGTTHIIGDQYPEIVSWDITASPVPEPATMLLFGTGIAGLAGSRLRRRKKA